MMSEDDFIVGISKNGFEIWDEFLTSSELSLVNSDFDTLKPQFSLAAVGKNHQTLITNKTKKVRTDQTYWVLDTKAGLVADQNNPAQSLLQNKIEKIKGLLNRHLYLGLWDFEGHYASYPPGAYYEKHVDQFQGTSLRRVTYVLYLNQEWHEEKDGGSLVLYHKNDVLKLAPLGGRLVCFITEGLEHEVLLSQRERRSFTGWFKIRSN